MSDHDYSISEIHVAGTMLAGVRLIVPVGRVAEHFRAGLDQVYAAGTSHGILLDGQNVFIYRPHTETTLVVDFCVGVRAPFEPIGNVMPLVTPTGRVASVQHWGDYAGLGKAHAAIQRWCTANRKRQGRISWEVYGHWCDNPAERRTDVYHLLDDTPQLR